MGCTIHEPTYYTIYTPEKRSSNTNASTYNSSTNGQMSTIKQAALSDTNGTGALSKGSSNTNALSSSNGQPGSSAGRTNYAGQLYTEAPKDSLSPVSSNSASRIYSEPNHQAQTLARGTETGNVPITQDTTWDSQDQALTDADRAIVRQIRRDLRQNSEFKKPAPELKIIAENGKVILGGTVKTGQEKERLEVLAQTTKGVVSVRNELVVKPDS